ncbi:hypothetical protein Egran_04786, partial [Elaphomyces granulatus]
EGADTESRDKYGRTILHLAAESSDVAVVRLLLDYGADMEAKDNRELTVLHSAVHNDHGEVQ